METNNWNEIETGDGGEALCYSVPDSCCDWLIVGVDSPSLPEQGQPCRLVLECAGSVEIEIACPNPAAARTLAESINVHALDLSAWGN